MFFRTVRRGARAMLQAPFPVNAARAGDLRAVTAWRQRCATTEANPVDARFPFDEWRPLQLACAEGDAAAVETILAAGAAVDVRGGVSCFDLARLDGDDGHAAGPHDATPAFRLDRDDVVDAVCPEDDATALVAATRASVALLVRDARLAPPSA